MTGDRLLLRCHFEDVTGFRDIMNAAATALVQMDGAGEEERKSPMSPWLKQHTEELVRGCYLR